MARIGKWQAALLASGAIAALVAVTDRADAGGFGVREQSAEFQGMSYAGNAAAGGGLSGMFWNPAIAAYAPVGIYSESHYSAIFGHVDITAGAGTTPALLAFGANSGDIADPAVVPSSYFSVRLSDRLVAALSINSPFGLVNEPSNRVWAGQTFGRTSEIRTYNFAPTLAYAITPTLSIGGGLQMQRIEGRLKSASGITPGAITTNTLIQGDDFAFGWTAGLSWTPAPGTAIGIGWRSHVSHTLEGNFTQLGTPINGSIKAAVDLPDIVTLSIRQALNDRWRLLGTVEWTNWSNVQQLSVICANNTTANTVCPFNGRLITSLPLGWHDGWFFSIGAEHSYSEKLTLRAGIAYELSPIRNAEERSLRVPDTDRLWLSVGATYKWNEMMAFDFSYSHIFGIGNDDINRAENGLRFVGTVDTSADIVSVSLKIKLGEVPTAAPLK